MIVSESLPVLLKRHVSLVAVEIVEIPIVGGQDVMTVGILPELDKDEYSQPNKIFCKIKYHSA
ncbi:hypothetical protein GMA8713_04341 [Grimontia marina]|uniref:Uncharacterized protein n=1 Tax=Grimontia marina TaxID=646534 RepID=A0A128FHN6_9GAMM|nr:hypothetical protein GMA8713_04341 [Grimontia marina]